MLCKITEVILWTWVGTWHVLPFLNLGNFFSTLETYEHCQYVYLSVCAYEETLACKSSGVYEHFVHMHANKFWTLDIYIDAYYVF